MAPLPNVPFLQSLDLSFNHISEFSVVQALASFQHLRSLRVNDNPVQHEPNFYFSLQRLMPWTQHEFGHARHFPDERQISAIQAEAVMQSPDVVQIYRQGQWQTGIPTPAFENVFVPVRGHPGVSAAVVPGEGPPGAGDQHGDGRAVANRAARDLQMNERTLMMLEGAARRVRCCQVGLALLLVSALCKH